MQEPVGAAGPTVFWSVAASAGAAPCALGSRSRGAFLFLAVAVVVIAASVVLQAHGSSTAPVAVIGHVADGDTVTLTTGQRVRLVQIDTPEVFFGTECFGRQASATTKRLLPPGTRVRLLAEPATDRVDQYGRLLRYVIRVRDGLNVNIRLVAVGAAAPYYYAGRRGRYARRLDRLVARARRLHLDLWGACPRTKYDPYRGVQTRR